MECFRCKQTITKKDRHYAITEFDNTKKINTDYVHKICWDKFLGDINNASDSLSQSKYLLNAMGNHLKRIGIIPEEEVHYV